MRTSRLRWIFLMTFVLAAPLGAWKGPVFWLRRK